MWQERRVTKLCPGGPNFQNVACFNYWLINGHVVMLSVAIKIIHFRLNSCSLRRCYLLTVSLLMKEPTQWTLDEQ